MTPTEIRAARQSLGMTVKQFGHALGVQEQTARRWEIADDKASHRKPSTQTLMLLRQLLSCKPGAVWGQSLHGISNGLQTDRGAL